MKIVTGIGLAVLGAALLVTGQIQFLPIWWQTLAKFAPFFISIGASSVISGISDSIRGKQARASVLGNAQARLISVRSAAAPRRVIYGQVLVGGVLTYFGTTGGKNEFLHYVLTLTGHEVSEIGTMYFDGVEVPLDGSGNALGFYAGFVHVEKNLGTTTQAAFAGLTAALPEWTVNHRQLGCAGAYVRVKLDEKDPEKFRNGLPNTTFLVKGKKVFDPRPSPQVTAWSNNAALCLSDYLTSPASIGGLAATYATEIDETFLIAAANICEEAVALNTSPTTYENRYTISGAFEMTETPGHVIEQMFGAFAGDAVYSGGKWKIFAGAYRTPTLALTEADSVSPLAVTMLSSRRDLPNGVKGTHISAVGAYQQADFPPATNATYLSEDSNERFWKDINLPFTLTATMAQRLAKIELERARNQILVKGNFRMRAYELLPGDTVTLTNARLGFSSKVFEVAALQLAVEAESATLSVALVLREHSSAVFAWTASEQGTAPLASTSTLDTRLRPLAPATGTFGGAAGAGTAEHFQLRLADSRENSMYVRTEDNARARVLVIGPPTQQSILTRSPAIGQQPTVATTGGFLPGGYTLFYAVAAVDSGAVRSQRSRVVQAVIPAGVDTNKVTLTGLVFDAQAATMAIYRGRDPVSLLQIAEVALAASYEDTILDGGSAGPVDINLDHIQLQYRRVQSVDEGPYSTTSATRITLVNTALAMGVNAFANRIVEIVRGSGAAAGINSRRKIVSNTATELTIEGFRANISAISRTANVVTVTTATPHGCRAGGNITTAGVTDASFNQVGASITYVSETVLTFPQVAGDASSSGGTTNTGWRVTPTTASLWVIHHRATSSAATTITDSTAAWSAGAWVGFRVRIVDGPLSMLYQERTITGNTATQLTVAPAWDVNPDTTCAFEIVDGGWIDGSATPALEQNLLSTTFEGVMELPNEAGLLVEYTVRAFDVENIPSREELGPVNRYVVVGNFAALVEAAVEATPGIEIILQDRTTAAKRRMFLNNGVIDYENVP